VARLGTSERSRLPDRAFAYVDADGRRLLPIHDEAHVRAALARFNQVRFADEAGRDRALERVLRAAKRYRIVPVGFVSNQVRSGRGRAPGQRGGAAAVVLPTGFVTMLMTDMEGSTALVEQLGDGYGPVLDTVRSLLRATVEEHGGHVVEIRADDAFAVWQDPAGAVQAAVSFQRALAERDWPCGATCRMRVGIHSGYPTPAPPNYIGMAVHVTARVCAAAHGGQIVVSGDTRAALTGTTLAGVRFRRLGTHRLRGISAEVPLYQVSAAGLASRFPPVRTARRID
jgi:class 3 adenylate cyclase